MRADGQTRWECHEYFVNSPSGEPRFTPTAGNLHYNSDVTRHLANEFATEDAMTRTRRTDALRLGTSRSRSLVRTSELG